MSSINSFYNTQCWAFFTFFLASVGICLLMLALSFVLGGRSRSRNKHTPFESGIDPVESSHLNVSVKFYLIAIYFVFFDVEALYLYLWSINIIEIGWIGFVEIVFFISFLLSGLIYLIRLNAFNWGLKYPLKNINV
ncbi:MAG: NADH-quinone oxidoreductase subunit A [Buchnera aphidicola (Floraphis choui)]